LLKTTADRAEVDVAIRAVAKGHIFLSPAVTKPVVEVFVRSLTGDALQGPFPPAFAAATRDPPVDSPGQLHRARCAAPGLSVKTVETHRAQLMRAWISARSPVWSRYAIGQ